MAQAIVFDDTIRDFFSRVDGRFGATARIWLIGETTQVSEGWRRYTSMIEFCSSVAAADRVAFNTVVREVADEMAIRVVDEYPGEIIPLPEGFDGRNLPPSDQVLAKLTGLDVLHFDPYSVSYRFIARGDEPDYHLVLAYLNNGWITVDELDEHLENLLPKFTLSTIQQDPAEFRRKYGGLKQMIDSIRPGATHRSTSV